MDNMPDILIAMQGLEAQHGEKVNEIQEIIRKIQLLKVKQQSLCSHPEEYIKTESNEDPENEEKINTCLVCGKVLND